MKKKIILFILVILSCSKSKEGSLKNEEINNDNTNNIIHLLYDDIITHHIKTISIPPPHPPNPNSDISWDFIKKKLDIERSIKKDTLKELNNYVKKYGKLIVAISQTLFVPYTDNLKKEYFQEYLEEYDSVFYSFKEIKDSVVIDVSKIPNNNYSYILPYQEFYKNFNSKGYDKYDIILSFSRISFNKSKTKAIIIMGAGFGKLNGYSAIYFLEKVNEKWFIKYEKGLNIS